jgi:hypothetical protein
MRPYRFNVGVAIEMVWSVIISGNYLENDNAVEPTEFVGLRAICFGFVYPNGIIYFILELVLRAFWQRKFAGKAAVFFLAHYY